MPEFEGLPDEEVARERELLEGVPYFNVGAFLLPPIWGPAHGTWLTVLWYPVWILVDDIFFATWRDPSMFNLVIAVLTFVILLAATLLFSRLMQVRALHRAIDEKGKTKGEYLRTERRWAVASAIAAAALVAGATYYNLAVRAYL